MNHSSGSLHLKSHHILPCDHFSLGLRIAHLNIHSVCAHYHELSTLLKNKPLDVVALSETWLDQSIESDEINISGYTIVRKDRNRGGGGVMFYVLNTIQYSCKVVPSSLEIVSIIIKLDASAELAVTNVYKPPRDNYKEFETHLKCAMQSQLAGPQHRIVVGDFNCDMLKSNSSHATSLVKTMSQYCCVNIIQEPTRVTTTSSTCIDLMFTNDHSLVTQCGVEKVGVSDHFMPYAVFSYPLLRHGQAMDCNFRASHPYSSAQYQQVLQKFYQSFVPLVGCMLFEIRVRVGHDENF